MAFETADNRIAAVAKAGNLLGMLRTVHDFATTLQAAFALYQSGTDPTFNAAFNAVFSASDRQELGTMINQLTALAVTDWEANHPGALGI